MKKSYRLVGAFIMLSREKYNKEGRFTINNILYTRNELISTANRIPENARISVSSIDMNNVTIGIGSGTDKYFIKGSEDSLSEYFRLACYGQEAKYNLDRLIDKLAGGFPAIGDKESVRAYLDDYYRFVESLDRIEEQGIDQRLTAKEAVWIAAACLTYNEYYRSYSKNPNNYYFSQSAIANLAEKYNPMINSANYRQWVRANCTRGKNEQGYTYLIEDAGEDSSSRRLSYDGEGRLTKPDMLHTDFVVNTINGKKTVEELNDFVKNSYSQNVVFRENYITDNNGLVEEHNITAENDVIIKQDQTGLKEPIDYLKDVFIEDDKIRQIKRTLEKNTISSWRVRLVSEKRLLPKK